MRITVITVNTKIKNLLTMTIESKTKTTLKLITIGNNKSNLQKNCIKPKYKLIILTKCVAE